MAKNKPTLFRAIGAVIKDYALGAGGRPAAYSGAKGTLFGGTNILAERISVDNLYTVWRNHGDVMACVRELSENVGVAGYYFENKANPDSEPNAKSVELAEKMLASGKTWRQMKRRIIMDAEVTGNCYLHVEKSAGNGQPLKLTPVDPRTMSVVTDRYGDIVRWVQRYKGATVEFAPDEILHFKVTDDPNSPVFGLSPLETIFWEVKTDLAAVISNFAFFENDAVPAAQYILDEDISDEEAEEAIEKLKEQIRGAENRHQGAAMKGIKEVKILSVSQKDMEFHVLRRFTTEKICAGYGVPKSVLNYTDDVNYANGAEQTKKFWEGTIEPLQEALAEFINKQLLPALGVNDIVLKFETRKFDDAAFEAMSSRADLQLGVMTINEIREQRGLQPFSEADVGEWADKPIIYGRLVTPLEDVGVHTGDGYLPTVADEEGLEKALGMINEASQRYANQNQPSKTGKS